MLASPQKTIVLIGLKHSGKSSIGQLLAEHLQRPFYDSDTLLEERYTAEKWTCRKIYLHLGKQGFDRLQWEVLQEFFRENTSTPAAPTAILALGGGVGDLPELGGLLRANSCCVILLHETLEQIFERIAANGLPPFLQNAADPFAEFQKISTPRLKNYRAWADTVLECGGRPLEEVFQTVLEALHK